MCRAVRARSAGFPVIAAGALLLLGGGSAQAQSVASSADARQVAVPAFAIPRAQLLELRPAIQPVQWPTPSQSSRPKSLLPLYVSFAALQALDAHSTLQAIDNGHGERNPVVGTFTSTPGAMVGLKLASTAGTIYLTERLWRKHRGAAIALMIAVNGAYAAVVAHNYRVR
jgi:uncharacterized protein DUF5658